MTPSCPFHCHISQNQSSVSVRQLLLRILISQPLFLASLPRVIQIYQGQGKLPPPEQEFWIYQPTSTPESMACCFLPILPKLLLCKVESWHALLPPPPVWQYPKLQLQTAPVLYTLLVQNLWKPSLCSGIKRVLYHFGRNYFCQYP